MPFELKYTLEAESQFEALSKDKALAKGFKSVCKALRLLAQDTSHSSLNMHKYESIEGPQKTEVFEAYAENKTPAAYRIFWCYYPPKQQGNAMGYNYNLGHYCTPIVFFVPRFWRGGLCGHIGLTGKTLDSTAKSFANMTLTCPGLVRMCNLLVKCSMILSAIVLFCFESPTLAQGMSDHDIAVFKHLDPKTRDRIQFGQQQESASSLRRHHGGTWFTEPLGCAMPAGQISIPKNPPSISGTWYINSPSRCEVTFHQEGNKLTGHGDADPGRGGKGYFVVEDGRVEGMNIRFVQRFINDSSRRPISCNGNLAFHHSPYYDGWMMEGVTDSLLLQGLTCWSAWKTPTEEFAHWGGGAASVGRGMAETNKKPGDLVIQLKPPAINGSWRFTSPTYFQMDFLQDGSKFVGFGHKNKGKGGAGNFVIENGSIDGDRIRFTRADAGSAGRLQYSQFSGFLSYHYSPCYEGWMMEGTCTHGSSSSGSSTPTPWFAYRCD